MVKHRKQVASPAITAHPLPRDKVSLRLILKTVGRNVAFFERDLRRLQMLSDKTRELLDDDLASQTFPAFMREIVKAANKDWAASGASIQQFVRYLDPVKLGLALVHQDIAHNEFFAGPREPETKADVLAMADALDRCSESMAARLGLVQSLWYSIVAALDRSDTGQELDSSAKIKPAEPVTTATGNRPFDEEEQGSATANDVPGKAKTPTDREGYSDPDNFDRNLWLYEQREQRTKMQDIMVDLNNVQAKEKGWEPLYSETSIRSAADSIAVHMGRPKVRLKGGRPKKPHWRKPSNPSKPSVKSS